MMRLATCVSTNRYATASLPGPARDTINVASRGKASLLYLTTKFSPRLIRSQNLLRRQTRPMPLVSSRFLATSSRSLTSPFHLAAIQRRRPSLTFSFSMALRLATMAGDTCTGTMPGTHSLGSTARSTRASAEGRAARRRERRMETSDRASRRDTMDVWVRKMERAMRLASDGR